MPGEVSLLRDSSGLPYTHTTRFKQTASTDGGKADCILYYAYKDKKVLEMMIRKGSNNPYAQSTARKIDQLYTCLRYCENEFLCRRTLQLEFFGETFDRSKCKETCDNCRAGREAEGRDLTEEALAMLQLLTEMTQQRGTRGGVTLLQLTELFRGSKSKSATKFLDISRLNHFGVGKKYQKKDIDRISHAMVYEKILLESSEQNGSGFNSDYVRPGIEAPKLQNRQRSFVVQFPKAASKSVSKNNKNAKEGKANKKKSPKKKTPKKFATRSRQFKNSHLQTMADSDSESADDDPGRTVGAKSLSTPSLLPHETNKKLIEIINKLVGMWAEEEQLAGNKVFCESGVILFAQTSLRGAVLTFLYFYSLEYHEA